MNTSSTSPSKTLITAEPKPKARKQMESASASIAPSWMSFTGWRSAKRSTARSTSCRPTLMCGSPNTTSTGPITVAGALARPRCRPFLTRYHWQRKNSWRHDHTRQPYRPHCQHRLSDQVSANTIIEISQNVTVQLLHKRHDQLGQMVRSNPFPRVKLRMIGIDVDVLVRARKAQTISGDCLDTYRSSYLAKSRPARRDRTKL